MDFAAALDEMLLAQGIYFGTGLAILSGGASTGGTFVAAAGYAVWSFSCQACYPKARGNPVYTLVDMINGGFQNPVQDVVNVVFQALGYAVAGCILCLVIDKDVSGVFLPNQVKDPYSDLNVIVMELMLPWIIAGMVIRYQAEDGSNVASVRGLIEFVACMLSFNATNYGMNPLRTIASLIFSSIRDDDNLSDDAKEDFWIFVLFPLLGAALWTAHEKFAMPAIYGMLGREAKTDA